jgi:hypothetical protein
MKWLNFFVGLLILAMFLGVASWMIRVIIYAGPMIIAIITWYTGWDKTEDYLKLLAVFLLDAMVICDGVFALRQGANTNHWLNFVVQALFPSFLLLIAYRTKDKRFDKSIPILTFLTGFLLDVKVYVEGRKQE